MPERTKGGIVGFIDVQTEEGIRLNGIAYGIKADGTEYLLPAGTKNGKWGNKGRFEFVDKSAYRTLLDLVHSYYDDFGITRPA